MAEWPDDTDGCEAWAWLFCPKDRLRLRADRDGIRYPGWSDEGVLTPTPGNVVDLRTVQAKVRELCDEHDVREIAFDPHFARIMMSGLAEDGFPAVELRQGWVTMAPAVMALERAVVGRRFRHGGHPVLRWCFENVTVETDNVGNRMVHRGRTRDGSTALSPRRWPSGALQSVTMAAASTRRTGRTALSFSDSFLNHRSGSRVSRISLWRPRTVPLVR